MNLLRKLLFLLSIFFIFSPETMNKMGDREVQVRRMFEIVEQERKRQYIEEIIEEIEWHAEIKIPDSLDRDHLIFMYETALSFDLPLRITFRLINQESLFEENALSPVGAYGFMQLMPGTYDEYHRRIFGNHFIEDHNPYKNIYIGMYYLRELHDYWGQFARNDEYIWSLALASYNAGKGRVIRHRGVPPFRETRNYVAYIMRDHSKTALFAQK